MVLVTNLWFCLGVSGRAKLSFRGFFGLGARRTTTIKSSEKNDKEDKKHNKKVSIRKTEQLYVFLLCNRTWRTCIQNKHAWPLPTAAVRSMTINTFFAHSLLHLGFCITSLAFDDVISEYILSFQKAQWHQKPPQKPLKN